MSPSSSRSFCDYIRFNMGKRERMRIPACVFVMSVWYTSSIWIHFASLITWETVDPCSEWKCVYALWPLGQFNCRYIRNSVFTLSCSLSRPDSPKLQLSWVWLSSQIWIHLDLGLHNNSFFSDQSLIVSCFSKPKQITAHSFFVYCRIFRIINCSAA